MRSSQAQTGVQGSSETYFNSILCDVQFKINRVNGSFPLITHFSCESRQLVRARAQAAVTAILQIITEVASILPTGFAQGSVSGTGVMGGQGGLRKRVFWQLSSDAIAHSHRGRAASWARGMECPRWEYGCLSAGCSWVCLLILRAGRGTACPGSHHQLLYPLQAV